MDEYDLLSAIKKIRTRRCNFVFYKGDEANQLLVSPKRIKPKEAVELLAGQCGHIKPLAKGLCFQENDATIFATRGAAPKVLATLLTKVLRVHRCAKFFPFELRELRDDEGDEVDSGDEKEAAAIAGGGAQPGATSPGAGADDRAALLAAWTTARGAAVAQLQAIAQAIGKSKDPEAVQAIIQVKAMMANLTPKPSDRNAVAELQRYLATDELVEDIETPNPWGIKVELRKPLLAALSKLAGAL